MNTMNRRKISEISDRFVKPIRMIYGTAYL